MAVAPQKILANKSSLASLLLLSQPSAKSHHQKRHLQRRKTHKIIKYDPNTHSSVKKQSKTSHFYDAVDIIDPSQINRINGVIKDSFYSMSEKDPSDLRVHQDKGFWASIFVSNDNKQTKSNNENQTVSTNFFKLKELISADHGEDLAIEQKEYDYFYDNEQKSMALFYKELNLSIRDVIQSKEVVLKGRYHCTSLHEIERYIILFYDNIKKCSLVQLQELWLRLKQTHGMKMPFMPTISIVFGDGKQAIDVSNLLIMLCETQMDYVKLNLLRFKQAMRTFHQRTAQTAIGYKKDRFSDLKLDEISVETAEEHHMVSGYNSNDFWSVSDGFSYPFVNTPSPPPQPRREGTLFGLNSIKPKSAVT